MSQSEQIAMQLDNERGKEIVEFLQSCGCDAAERTPLPSDASPRRYQRLGLEGETAMLMDSDPAQGQDIRPFLAIDTYLRDCHLNAPEIIAKDTNKGLILLEDFGDNLFSTKLLEDNSQEGELYRAAIDVLLHLNQSALPHQISDYTSEALMREAMLLVDWYLPYGGREATHTLQMNYTELWQPLLDEVSKDCDTLVLRDYHADNLMWLPERDALMRVGLLDFQDALIGSAAYDLVSLLEDARRDVSPELAETMLTYYLSKRGDLNPDEFRKHYAILGAQRNCKILGIFARLATRDHKTRYLKYLPRVWDYLMQDLQHPALCHIKAWVKAWVPSPHLIG